MKAIIIATLAFGIAALPRCNAQLQGGAAPGISSDRGAADAPAPATVAASSPAPAINASLPTVLVHKSPTCGCCGAWVEHMQRAGFTVQVDEREDLEPIRKQLGVPYAKGSCHTAEVDGYVVEGHVPADDVKRLLKERPEAKGLVLPGMPLGSPGMESPDGRVQPYTVELIEMNGTTRPFAHHGR